MRRRLATVYALLNTALLAAGIFAAFYFAWQAGVYRAIEGIVGIVLGFALAPTVHELGHFCFAKIAKMECVYIKFFCFKVHIKSGKKRFAFASPFAPDQTQVIPKKGGNMQNRARLYTVGGLICSGACLAVLLAAALVCTLLGRTRFDIWGMVPYFAYLFLLNVLPLEYASGKTDVSVYKGMKKGFPAEKTMLSAMEIQGQLYEGKSFSEIDEAWFFELPQLCEDEPMYAVILDLRYRYYLEKEEIEKAGDCLNRLAQAQAFLADKEIEKVAAELTYMHAVLGDTRLAAESGKLCTEFLKEDTATAKRILAAYSLATGKTEAVEPLLKQAEEALQKERIAGLKKHEEILLSRLRAV